MRICLKTVCRLHRASVCMEGSVEIGHSKGHNVGALRIRIGF